MKTFTFQELPSLMKPCAWARWLKRSGAFVVWDTETTGLEGNSKIVSIGIVNHRGDVLLDTLINPLVPIPSDATNIHGVTDDMVKDAPTFAEVFPQIRRALLGERWVIYNKNYDIPRLQYEVWRHGLLYPSPAFYQQKSARGIYYPHEDTHCAMTIYAEHYGAWSDYHQSYTWQSLSNAARQQGIKQGQAHNALDDAITTLNLINVLALSEDNQ